MDKKTYNRKYREQHREELNAKARGYYWLHREEVKKKVGERYRRRKEESPESVREEAKFFVKSWRLKNKITILTHYGNNKLACVRCGFADIRALSIDHIDGKGRLDRRLRGRVGNFLYRQLIKEGFPTGFQTLCMNCQWVKRFENNENR